MSTTRTVRIKQTSGSVRVFQKGSSSQILAKVRNKVSSRADTKKQADPIGTAMITCNAINVRKGPGTQFERIGGLTKGKTIEVYADEGDWLKIKYGSDFGYVAQQYTTFTDIEEPHNDTRIGVVNVESSLFVRKGPGTNYDYWGRLTNGTEVVIIGEEGNWYKIEYGSNIGYVSKDYVKIKDSSTQPQDPVDPPEPPPETSNAGGINKTSGTIDYKQGDSRWGKKLYSVCNDPDQTYAQTGCGPTAAADVVWSLKDSSVIPTDIGDFAIQKGYRTKDTTSPSLFKGVANHYGLSHKVIGANLTELKKGLEAGGLVIAHMGPGQWTNNGHFICVWNYDGETVYVNNPGGSNRGKSQAASQFIKELKGDGMYLIK